MYINGKKVVIKVVPNVGVKIVPVGRGGKVSEAGGQGKRFPVGGKVLQRLAFFPGPIVLSTKFLIDLVQIAIGARGVGVF